MRRLLATAALTAVAAVSGTVPAALVPVAGAAAGHDTSLGRQVLGPDDGWAAEGTGTTGGAAAPRGNVHVVDTRDELVAALASPAPRIVHVRGLVEGDTDDTGRPLECTDHAAPGYSLPAYLAAYDPAVWGRDTEPSGPLEDARAASAANQAAQVTVRVGSDTTLVGLGRHAVLKGLNLRVQNADNVIIRNLAFVDAADCFPAWDPTDGTAGEWNSAYDNVSVIGSTHVWLDHNTFTDGDNPDSAQPTYFGRPYQVHDGELDITGGSSLLTVSWNRFTDHDKTMLIGSTDNPATDRGRLDVTVHHNLFDNTVQRLPRVRFGRVHVYNNHYRLPAGLGYALGVGVESRIVAEHNVFEAEPGVGPGELVHNWGGTALTARGNLWRAGRRLVPVDLVGTHNAGHDPDLGVDVGWEPTRHGHVDSAYRVPSSVAGHAGAGGRAG